MQSNNEFKITRLQRTKVPLWLAVSTLLFLLSTFQPQGIFGDGLEYILQTQSFLFEQSISIERESRSKYWNQTNPYTIELSVAPSSQNGTYSLSERDQAGGGFGSLYPNRNGEYYFVHSWVYSLFCSPIYGIVKVLFNYEYRSFAVANSLFLGAALVWGAGSLFGFLVAAFILCTPIAGYLSWTTPEVFQFSLLSLGFSAPICRRKFLAPLLVGIAGAQNFPALAFLAPLALLKLKDVPDRKWVETIKGLVLEFVPGVIIGLLPWIYYFIKFGTPNLIVALNQASTSNSSFPRLISFLFSPLAGAFWFYPVFFLFLPLLFLNSKPQKTWALILITTIILLLSYAMTGMLNFHSQQLGATRYAAWIFAPVAGLLLSADLGTLKAERIFLCFALVLTVTATHFYKNYLFILGKHPRTNYLGLFPEPAKRLYRLGTFNEEPEVLVEQLRREELRAPWEFDARYEIPIGDNQALCLVSKRSLSNGKTTFIPNQNICSNLKLPALESGAWKSSSTLGTYYLERLFKN
jgi:hypothetical protein